MRRSERIPCTLPVRWIRWPVIVDAVAADMNLKGLFLRTDETIRPGSLMHLQIELPDGMMIAFVAARFVGETQSGVGIGCEFVVVDELDRGRWIACYQCGLAEGQPERQLAAAASVAVD